ncbi:protein TPX2-like isoform X2 [Mercurialis annua]|uniref:protein TPX2-like isoform X2 n=1 Tax=Mercurialis annua TaxID=3986 RepID=UPI00215E5D00|nr:protein TPX2-like isoform X2 [Mercurialis annua]
MEMDELFNESSYGDEEIDFDYEYDAAKYYDFTRPETEFEAYQAQRWFVTASSYPPSPLIIKFNWEPSVAPVKTGRAPFMCGGAYQTINRTSSANMSRSVNSDEVTSPGSESSSPARSFSKSPLSKYSSFMNPTASQLAKLNHLPQIHCNRLFRRSQKQVKIENNSPRNSSVNGVRATKRQKLEAGYLSKVALLKHQANFLHKEPKKVGLTDLNTTLAKPDVTTTLAKPDATTTLAKPDVTTTLAKSKFTVPKEPNLETAFRAERHRTKNNLEPVEAENSNACIFRARPLNRKILEAPSFPLHKKSTPQLPEFQVFHLRTSERAMQHQFINERNAQNSCSSPRSESTSSTRVIPVAGFKEKGEALDRIRTSCLNKKESNSTADKRFPDETPIIDSFSKLSLTSEVQFNTKSRLKMPSHSKGLKENTPGSVHLEQEMRNVIKSPRLGGNHFQCGSDRTMMVPQINRSLDIR